MDNSIYWLWMTCRVIANENRLHLLKLILKDPAQCVKDLAAETGLTPSATSTQLKRLCEEHLISAHRTGLMVHYSFGSKYAPAHILSVQAALKKSLSVGTPYQSIIRQATGCTHQRRIELIQRIATTPSSVEELVQKSRMSSSAIARHIRKLEARGYVVFKDGRYHNAKPAGHLASALSKVIIQASRY
ncbi:MAG: winged helix-turn-helix transcriptional regulator [Kiritimatiellaeota bacterium]|nr:winged helix-turn-helix transcriptional regulator [Kiritimatiellota bacterium]